MRRYARSEPLSATAARRPRPLLSRLATRARDRGAAAFLVVLRPLRRPPDTSDVVSGVDAAVVSAEAPGPPLSARMSMPRSIAGRSAVASPLSLPDRTSSSCTRGCPDDRSTLTVVWLLVAFAGSGVMVMTYLLMS